jgi:hypothetical protein
MAKQKLVITNFSGGQSGSPKEGVQNSFAYSRHCDFRKDPNRLTILPKTARESATTVTGLVTDMIKLPSGKRVAIDSVGGVYEVSTLGVWTKHGTTLTNTAYGMVYNLQHDTIYVPGLTAMHSITNADGRFGGTFTPTNSTFTALVDQSGGTSVNTYTTTGSITETATHKLNFTPTIEPLYSVKVWVTTKGSTHITATLHDSANNTLGTVTVLAANLTNAALNEFVFSTPIRTTAGTNGSQYHVHLTHTSGTASTIGCTTASDVSTASYQSLANRLVDPINNFHPVYEFLQYYLILNERYVAAWEPISQSAPTALEFQQHRLTFPSGYEGTSGAVYNEYFAIATEKRSTSATSEFQTGKIFFWDGISSTYNFILDVPDGAPYSLFSHKNILYYFAGGSWWAWSGGIPVKIFQFPFTDTEFADEAIYFVSNPHMMAVRNTIMLGGFPSETSSTTTEHGIFSYGARMRGYPDAFGYSYTMSTGTRTNGTLRLGMVKSFGDQLYLSWRDDSNYAVDSIGPNSDPFPAATWESLITDHGRPDKTKEGVRLVVTFKPLPTGATVTPKYKLDRNANWTSGTAATATATSVTLNINQRYSEIQLGLDLVATTATPEILSVTLIYEDLGSERD